MNFFAVISRGETQDKLAFGHPLIYPRFSVLDPETTFTLPARQIANGVVDAFVHVLEQYLTYPADAPLQDRLAEAILLTLIEEGPKTLAAPADYTARANLMWCATMALNGLIAAGVPQDWATHMIGHEITALHGLDHAQTLAVVLPGTMIACQDTKREKILQFAERVWGIREGTPETRIVAAVEKTRGFFESLGVPTRLSDYGVSADTVPVIAGRMEKRGVTSFGERGDVTPAKVREILALCV
jgi:NADP-dependent alcohol dehydrogenase